MDFTLDQIDIKILDVLQQDGRITNARLAEIVGISAPSMLERVKKLVAAGVIDRYVALLNHQLLGYELMAMVVVSLSLHQVSSLRTVIDQLAALEEVQECYQLTGDVDFLLKVVTRNMESYTSFVNNKLSGIPGIQNIKTSFVLDTVKSSTKIKLS
ncbi:MAG: Lrp/AsnC family transcriptional regulator [Desulfobulbaceae bacterium]|nr:MAG: Lrp/AsnC family transcriptional regulator [Desulfobulbaceae bacterium]